MIVFDRRRQTTRAPLLHQIDLRLYYIPVGQHVFADEVNGIPSNHKIDFSRINLFKLLISRMLAPISY